MTTTKSAPKGRVIAYETIAAYLGMQDYGRLSTALEHLSATPTMVEVKAGYWITFTKLETPPAIHKGAKVLVMTRRKS
jgi:hypothetical protein